MGNVSCEWVRLPDGARVYTELHRAIPDDTEGVTVVLLHGWTLDHRLWRRQVHDLPHLDPAPARVLAVDLRGHGRSSCTDPTTATLAHLADDLAAVLQDRLGDGRVILVGHSLGGMAVLEYAHRHRADFARRVAGVVLVSTSAEGSAHTSYGLTPQLAKMLRGVETRCAGVLARSGAWRPHRMLMPLFSPGVRWLVFGQHVDLSMLALTGSMIGAAPLCAIGGFRPAVGLHDRVESLDLLRDLPVRILVGSRDRLTPPVCAEHIAARLPAAESVVCPGAGHMLPIERPDEVTGAIRDVLAACHADTTGYGTVDA